MAGPKKNQLLACLDPVHVGGDTNKPLDSTEGFLRTLSMYAREAVERPAYPGQRKSLSDGTKKNIRDPPPKKKKKTAQKRSALPRALRGPSGSC